MEILLKIWKAQKFPWLLILNFKSNISDYLNFENASFRYSSNLFFHVVNPSGFRG